MYAATNDTSQYGVDKKHATTDGISMTSAGNQKFFRKYEKT